MHCLSSAAAPLRSARVESKPDSSSKVRQKREENSAEVPPSALANDDALPGLEQNCVREIYTHNTPGALELHRAPKHRHSITFYMIAGRAGLGRGSGELCHRLASTQTHTEGGFGPASRNQRSLGRHPGLDPPPTRPRRTGRVPAPHAARHHTGLRDEAALRRDPHGLTGEEPSTKINNDM
ncbi:hypothetical protein L3Q82_002492 [Scortum barcoo]|uniref:Uncharacterized protein n=1 Tax=Scortum barcoo TaxID=214431 RepID=A0ACB8VYE1_9TELE|nr:hypothetical protein L3Q82_002492 [Scortum barcoo]